MAAFLPVRPPDEVIVLYCANCLTECDDGRAVCPECGAALEPGTRPPTTGATAEGGEPWVALLRARRPDSASIICGLLTSDGIPCQMMNKALSEMPVPAATYASYFEIWVPADQAARARALLNEARQGTVPCPSCGHMSAAEEPRCEYCDAPIAAAQG